MTDEHLTHGWEADLPAADSLLRRFVLANAHHTQFVANAVGGRVLATEAVSAADTDSAVFFDNFAVLLQPPAYIDLDTVLAELTAFYPAERHWCLLSAWPTPDLTGHGLALMGHPPFMVRPAGGPRRGYPRDSRSSSSTTRRSWRTSSRSSWSHSGWRPPRGCR